MPGIHDRRRRRAFAVMLLPLVTVAVHQLRYALDYGTHASRALSEQDDGLCPG
jgi:hypothetical protein